MTQAELDLDGQDKNVRENAHEIAIVDAAQCWCDDRVSDRVMDPELATVIAEKLQNWILTANQYFCNAKYYHDLLEECGRTLGIEAFTADDGTISETVLCAKVPELLNKLKSQQPSVSVDLTTDLVNEVAAEFERLYFIKPFDFQVKSLINFVVDKLNVDKSHKVAPVEITLGRFTMGKIDIKTDGTITGKFENTEEEANKVTAAPDRVISAIKTAVRNKR